jgi:HEAT repeat protein
MRRSFVRRLVLITAFLSPFPLTLQAAETDDEQILKQARIPTTGAGLVDFFKQRTPDAGDEKEIKALVAKLGDESFEVREEASKKLVAFGPRARAALRKAMSDPDLEIARRAEDCLSTIQEEGARAPALAAALRLLAQRKPAKAAATLLAYLPSAEEESVVEDVFDALRTLAVADGKADPAIVEALNDKLPIRRAAAGAALARAKATDQLPAVRKLLADRDLNVRLRVAFGLAAAREAEAVPAMLALLIEPKLTAVEAGEIEQFLCRLAEDKAPTESLGIDAASRKKYRDAWAKWWETDGVKLASSRLEEAVGRSRGYTLVILLDMGRILDMDAANKTRFELNGLEFPLDAQVLPGERVLVAEHEGSRVTERSRDNKIVWQHRIDNPLVAQRLANGNTFIATHTQLLEVDKDGKEVSSINAPGGAPIMKALKLPGGDVVCITQVGGTGARFQRLTSKGVEVKAFDVALRTSGGRIDVLANGHVLVPEKDRNKVVEYDSNGSVVWEVTTEQPVAAVRLPNGNTLVTSFSRNWAVELDRTGKEVWSYRSNTRVTRAFRR